MLTSLFQLLLIKCSWRSHRFFHRCEPKRHGTTNEREFITGFVTWCGWTVVAYQSKHCTGRLQDTVKDQLNQRQTGEELSRKTYKEWSSAVRRRRQRLSTDKKDVEVWSTASTLTWVESGSRSRSVGQLSCLVWCCRWLSVMMMMMMMMMSAVCRGACKRRAVGQPLSLRQWSYWELCVCRWRWTTSVDHHMTAPQTASLSSSIIFTRPPPQVALSLSVSVSVCLSVSMCIFVSVSSGCTTEYHSAVCMYVCQWSFTQLSYFGVYSIRDIA